MLQQKKVHRLSTSLSMQDVSEDGCGTVLQVDRAKWMLGLFGNLAFSEMALSDLSNFPLCEKGHGLMSLAFRLLQRKVPDPIFHDWAVILCIFMCNMHRAQCSEVNQTTRSLPLQITSNQVTSNQAVN